MGRGATTAKGRAAHALITLRGARGDEAALQAALEEASFDIKGILDEDPHFSQVEAAELLGVSKTTLDKWVALGRIPLENVTGYKRPRVPAEPLVRLATEVKALRRKGRKRGLLVEALSRLEQEDPEFRRAFGELYGDVEERPFVRSDYVSAAPGPGWDSED
jgi:excisionase family DNA binding protein